MQCGQLYILTTQSSTTRLKVHGFRTAFVFFFGWCWSTFLPASPRLSNTSIMKPQLISAISCPKAGWFITWSSKQRCLGNRFLQNGDLPYFCNISCPRILLFSHTVSASNESSFVSNRYNYHDPKLHTVGTYEAVANGALLSLVSKIVTIDRSGQEPWH